MGKYDLPQVETHLYINGKWLEGSEGTVDVVNPATGETLASVQQGGEKDKRSNQGCQQGFRRLVKNSTKRTSKINE